MRFGVFEMDLRTGELRQSGTLIHLPPQAYKVLALLASRPGELVTREEIRRQIWGENTFVDYEQGLRVAIKKIRAALHDSSQAPRYIETLSRRGYRFIAPVDGREYSKRNLHSEAGPETNQQTPALQSNRLRLMALIFAAIVVSAIVLKVGRLHSRTSKESSPRINSIAVLPFENISEDPDEDYLAEGMTQELIAELGKIKGLRVVSRTTVMHYKGSKKTLPEIAGELNVDAVIEGTVQRSSSRLRVTTNLFYARTEHHLWGKTLERNMGDLMALQDDLSREIAQNIQVQLSALKQAR